VLLVAWVVLAAPGADERLLAAVGLASAARET
jgi:hypothetical protein